MKSTDDIFDFSCNSNLFGCFRTTHVLEIADDCSASQQPKHAGSHFVSFGCDRIFVVVSDGKMDVCVCMLSDRSSKFITYTADTDWLL
jgi:hypothetical protein